MLFTKVIPSYPTDGGFVKWLSTLLSSLMAFIRPARVHRGSSPLLASVPALLVQADLAIALGNINKALIVQKVHEWCTVNESKKSRLHHRDGHYWTFNSYEEWQQKHFGWLNVDTVRRLFRELEKDGILVAEQFDAHTGDCRKWWRVEMNAVNRKIKAGGKTSGGVILFPRPPEQTTQRADSDAPQQIKSSNKKRKQKPQDIIPDIPSPSAAIENEPAASTENEVTQQETERDMANEIWAMAGQQLSASDKTMSAWLKGSQLIDYAAGTYTIAVTSGYARQMLDGRYSRRVLWAVQNLHRDAKSVMVIQRSQSA